MKVIILIFFFLILTVLKAEEWTGGSGWAKFDVPERRAMWVWSMGDDGIGAGTGTQKWDAVDSWIRGFQNYKGSRDLFLDFCENKSIRCVYMFNVIWEWDQTPLNAGEIPNEADFAEFMAEAAERGIQVWLMGYLWDDLNDSRFTTAASKDSIKKIMIAIKNFNDAHPDTPIAGYHNDDEPTSSGLWDDLLDTLKNAQDWVDANAAELMISQALCGYWRSTAITWNSSSKTMNNHIIDLIGHTAYMAYSDTPSTVLNTYAAPAVDRATSAGHKAAIGIETENIAWMYADAANDTWWEEILAEPAATRFKVDAAAPVTFEDCMHSTAAALVQEAGYDRMVIHQYSAYFTHWFGMRPREYCLSRPGGEYDSAAENPDKVNLLADERPLTGLGPRPADDGNKGDTGTGCAQGNAGTGDVFLCMMIMFCMVFFLFFKAVKE